MPKNGSKKPSPDGPPKKTDRSIEERPSGFVELLKVAVLGIFSALGLAWWRRHMITPVANTGPVPSKAHLATESAETSINPNQSQESPVGHEVRDISIRGIVIFLVIIVVGAVVIQTGLWIWVKALARGSPQDDTRELRPPVREASSRVPEYPKLQISPRRDWQAYLAEQKNLLNSRGWVDRSNGIVRIPIDEAIEIVAARGLPMWGATNRSISPLELQQQRAVEEGGKTR